MASGGISDDDKKCMACFKCCVQIWNGELRDCMYLKREGLKGICTVYDTRLGRDLGNGYTCQMRDSIPVNYPDCHYNREGQPMHPIYEAKNA